MKEPSQQPGSLDRRRLRGARLRQGFPAWLAWLLLAITPLCLSGPLRALTSLPLARCLPLALIVTLVCAAPFLSRPRLPVDWRRSIGLAALLLLLALAGFGALFNRYYRGAVVLSSSGIPDAGNHVLSEHRFVTDSPAIYNGFVSLLGFVEWVKRIARTDDYWGFIVATYAAMLIYLVMGLAAAATVLQRFATRPRAYRIGLVAGFVSSLAVALVALPFLHYHHAQGFFPPIFGLLPLVGLWIADAMVRTVLWRWFALAVLLVLYRFTYGLNLPDLLAAFAILLVADAWTAPGWLLKAALALLSVAAIGAAIHAARALQPVFLTPGPFLPYDVHTVLVAQWLAIAVIAIAALSPLMRGALAGSGVKRWVRLPLMLAALNAAFMTLVPKPSPMNDYYYLKTNFHAILLLLAASVVLVTALVSGMVDRWSERPRLPRLVSGGIVTVALALALLELGRGFAVYWPSFAQRAFGSPPFTLLQPLVDRGAWKRIDRVLAQHRARFGGYITSYYPTFNFMNASFDYWNGGISFYYGWPPAERPGYCVFWEGGAPESRLESVFPQQPLVDRLSREPQRTCVGYRPSWKADGIRTLCWLCP